MLDYEEILRGYGIENLSAQDFLRKLAGAEEFFQKSELADIYNYILLNAKDVEILIGTVKLSDNIRAKSTLSILIDILLLKITHNLHQC